MRVVHQFSLLLAVAWTEGSLASRLASESDSLMRRDVAAGGGCGTSAGNAVCAPGLCCSAGGICGTGTSFCGAPDCQLSFGPACDGNQVPTGQDTSSIPRPTFGNVPYGVSISHCSVNGKVALTFDDGPYIYTSELLDILKKNNVRATFFVVGNNGGKGQIELTSTGYPAIIQRMYSEGHQIGSHSWSHQDLSKITVQQRHEQIIRNEIAFVDILGFLPTYFRPPYTNCPSDCLKDLGDLGYHVVNYDIDTRDWQNDYTYAQNLYNSILVQHSPASSSWISLAHDVLPDTVHGFAQYMVDQAKKLGYELVTIGQCLGDPEENWYRDPSKGQPWASKAPASSTTTASAAISAASGTSVPYFVTSLPALSTSKETTTSPSTSLQSATSTTPTTKSSTFTTTLFTPLTTLTATSAIPPSSTRGSSLIAVSVSTSNSVRVSISSSSTAVSALPTSSTTATPTSVSGGNFGAGTMSQTSSSVSSHPSATSSPAVSDSVEVGASSFGLLIWIFALLLMY
ncbi:hypothetical protein BJ170DRAFT_264509 [Xylariales sp. AK1849]|nr:hypothetical protein BJ170DRAFT_264509 [Xylariales sp. AK1849]